MSSKQLVKSFIDEPAANVLDSTHKVLRLYRDKKEADKVVKYLIKSMLKIMILSKNDQFSREELNFLDQFSTKFTLVASKFISFFEDRSTYDKAFLQNLLEECRVLGQSIIQRHLTAKSKSGVDLVFNTFAEEDLLDGMFTGEPYKENMEKIVEGLKHLKQQGNL